MKLFSSCRVIQSEKYLFQTTRAERLVDYWGQQLQLICHNMLSFVPHQHHHQMRGVWAGEQSIPPSLPPYHPQRLRTVMSDLPAGCKVNYSWVSTQGQPCLGWDWLTESQVMRLTGPWLAGSARHVRTSDSGAYKEPISLVTQTNTQGAPRIIHSS